MKAKDFLDGLGVGTHISGRVMDYSGALTYLGIHNVRDGIPAASESVASSQFQSLIDLGVKFNVGVPIIDGKTDIGAFISRLHTVASSLSSIEGANEVNIWPVSYNGLTGDAAAVTLQTDLYHAIKSDPVLSHLPVYNLTEDGWGSGAFAGLGNLSSVTDYANIHAYPRNDNPNFQANEQPGLMLNYALQAEAGAAPGKPTVITEGGYNTAPLQGGVSEGVAAKYDLDLLMDAAHSGISKTYLYELFDDNYDPNQTYGENHWGLFDGLGKPKASAVAIHNLTSILSDNNHATGLPDGIITADAGQGDKQLLLQKTGGVIDMVVWAEPNIWQGSEKIAPEQTVHVKFSSVGNLSVYDPLLGTDAVQKFSNASSADIKVSDHPVIVEFTPLADPVQIRISDAQGHSVVQTSIAQGTQTFLDKTLDQPFTQSVGSNGVVTISTPLWNGLRTVNVHDSHGGSYATNAFMETNFSLSGAEKGSLLLTNAKRGVIDLSHDGNYHVTINAYSNGADPSVNGKVQHLNDFVISLGSGENSVTINADNQQTHAVITTGSGHAVITAIQTHLDNTFTFGSGRAEVSGGTGSDHYVYHASSGVDTVQNFDIAHDTLAIDTALKSSMHMSTGSEGTTLMFGNTAHEIVLHAIQNFDSSHINWV